MPRIYHLATDLGPSAVGKQLSLLAPELAARGVEQAVGVLGEWEPFGPVVAAAAPVERFHRWGGLFDLKLPRTLKRATDRYRPDAVVTWGYVAAEWAAAYRWLAGGPPVFALCPVGAWPWWAKRVTVLPFTAEEARFAASHYRLPADRVRPVPPAAAPPVPVDPVAVRADLWLPADARLIVATGRFDAASDLRSAVWAFDILKHTDPRFRLVLLGDGAGRPAVEAFADALGRDDNRVTFAGSRADGPRVVAAADVAWVTHVTGGWNLAVEAAAAGVPVVGFRNPHLDGLVPAADLVDPGDRVRLAGRTAERLDEPPPAPRAFSVSATADAFLRAVFG